MSFKQKTLSGIGWSAVSETGEHLLQFVISIILARILSPKEFGLIAMITIFIGFANLFRDFGFTSALIQREKIEERHYYSIFWLNVGTGLVLTLIFIAISPIIAKFYKEPILISLTILVAMNFTINSLGNVQRAILTRNLNFKALAFARIFSIVLAGVVAIILALKDFGVWSLAWRSIITAALGTILLWIVSGWRPRFRFKITAVKDLWKYSSNLLGSLVINYFIRNSDNLLIGKYLGSNALGIYSKSYGFMFLPMKQISRIVGRVMFPSLSRIQHDKEKVKNIFLRTISAVAVVVFPLMFGLFVVSDNFVLALLGNKWADVIPVLRILSLLGAVQSLILTNTWIFTSQGKTDLMFKWYIIRGFFLIGSIVAGILIGSIIAVAVCYALMSGIILVYPEFVIPGKLINMKFKEVITSVSGTFTASLLMAFSVYGIGHILPRHFTQWGLLLIKTLAGMVIYISIVHLSKLKAYVEIRDIVKEKLGWKFLKKIDSHKKMTLNKKFLLLLRNPRIFLTLLNAKIKRNRPLPKTPFIKKINTISFEFPFEHNHLKQMYLGTYELETVELMRKYLRKGGVFIDIGANIGYLTAVAMGFVGKSGQVHSFEPVPEYFRQLKKLALLNKGYNLKSNRCALGSNQGKKRMDVIDVTIRPNIGLNTLVPNKMSPDQRKETTEVEVNRLDIYIKEKRIDSISLIKVDAEGYEFPVLRGLQHYFERTSNRPPIICEIDPSVYPPQGFTLEQLSEYMKNFKYRAFTYNFNNGLNEADITGLTTGTNVIFISR